LGMCQAGNEKQQQARQAPEQRVVLARGHRELTVHEVWYSSTRSLASGKPSSLSHVDEPGL
jgi:hypothetical protein